MARHLPNGPVGPLPQQRCFTEASYLDQPCGRHKAFLGAKVANNWQASLTGSHLNISALDNAYRVCGAASVYVGMQVGPVILGREGFQNERVVVTDVT